MALVRGVLSDDEWAFFAPFVIEQGRSAAARPADHRRVLDAVFWVARTGSPVPARPGATCPLAS